jgi:peptidoglycan/xylan/chitin deacetylase (PgdA/CDA1 family)
MLKPITALGLALATILPAGAQEARPIKVLIVSGGCCHNYAVQRDVLEADLKARINADVTQVFHDPKPGEKATRPALPIYGNPRYAEGYDVVLHNECAADEDDPAVLDSVLAPHRAGTPGVNLHCAMHSYRSGAWKLPVQAGAANARWFEYTGIQSSGHGPQSPVHLAAAPGGHPIAQGFAPYVTGNEELYNNLTSFGVTPILTGTQPDAKNPAERSQSYTVAWTHRYGPRQARVFSMTLAHNEAGIADPRYLDLLARGVLWATGHLADDGKADAGYVRAQAAAPEPFDVALTVDDLPAHGKLPAGMTRLGIAEAHIDTFRAHRVPEAFGFVNASKLQSEPGSEAVLDAWRKAGYSLGNHTYSHMNLDRAPSLDAWKADVVAGEAAVSSRMAGLDWRYLRFAFLAAGAERRDDALAFLRTRGYRVADVSLSFDDWAYTEAYARCVDKGDKDTIAAMKGQYLSDIDRGIADMKADSRKVFGRVIPQVLLTHVGGWSAATLPDVLARLEAAGARYVTLAQVQADPAYAAPGANGLIGRVAKQKGIALAADARREPGMDLQAVCR